MKRVLVTGATGFIGRHVLRPLAEFGFEVHAVRFRGDSLAAPAQWYRVDLLDAAAVKALLTSLKPSHLLHFAWYAESRDYRQSPENLRWCQAGIELLAQFVANGGRRIVFAGSCFEYDLRYGFCSEDLTPSTPATLYGTCKNALRQVALEFAQKAGISAAWARIFYLYGFHEAPERLVPIVIRALLRGERAKCTLGQQIRDVLYVEDVARALVALVDSKVQGVLNVGSGVPLTIRSLVERIAAIMESSQMVDFGAIEAAPADPPVVIANVRRLHAEVGWEPRWELDRGLKSTIGWWREHLTL